MTFGSNSDRLVKKTDEMKEVLKHGSYEVKPRKD